MKNFIYSVLCLCLLIMTGCANIGLQPQAQPTKETWYKNAQEMRMSTDALYSYKNWPLETRVIFNLDLWTDDYFQNGAISDPGPTGNIASDLKLVRDYWQKTYNAIANANAIINKSHELIENLSTPDETPDETTDESSEPSSVAVSNINSATIASIKNMMGEAYFMRGVFYSYIIFFWGDAPYFTTDLTIKDAEKMVRTPKSEILQHIYDDFDKAYELLPETNTGRVCKYTVAPFKARVALWMADWRMAADEAKKSIDAGVFKLDPSFEAVTSPSNNSKEWILTLKRSAALDNSSRFATDNWISRNVSGFTGNRGPSWELFLSFLCTDGLPVDKSPLYDPHNPFLNRDPRCSYTIVPLNSYFLGYEYSLEKSKIKNQNTGKNITNNGSPRFNSGGIGNFMHLKKGIDESWIDDKYAENQVPVLRFADVLLTYAEAKIELNEIDQTVLDAINKVRSRAYNGTDIEAPLVTTTNQAELRTQIRFERRMEFAFENKRYFDIIRWRLAETCMNRPMYQLLLGLSSSSPLAQQIKSKDFFFTDQALPIVDENALVDMTPVLETGTIRLHTSRSFPSRQYLLPIPSFDIMTAPGMKQNPGY